MVKKAFAGKRKVLVLSTVFAILIVGIIAIFVVKHPNEARERAEDTEHELPAEIQAEMERLFLEPEAIVRTDIIRWSVDTAEKRINIFVSKLTPENEQINGKVIDGWTILVIDDVELRLDVEKLNAELERLKGIPEMQIGEWSYGWNPRTGYKQVEIFVNNLTPENQQLKGKMIDGWEAHVYKSLIPPKVVALGDPRVKEGIGGKGYEVEELTKQTDRELLVDVYKHCYLSKGNRVMPLDMLRAICADFLNTEFPLPQSTIILSGSEPLLHSDFIEACSIVRGSLNVSVFSKGYIRTPKK